MCARAVRQKSANNTPTRDQGRVLIVTDEVAMSKYGAALDCASFAVVGVTGSRAALVELRRARPHVIVADVNLQGISARELARNLSISSEGIPLLMIGSAESTTAQRLAAMEMGAFDYHQLPAESALLSARIAQLMTLKQTTDRLREEANRDYLTGLANRRRFRTALNQELERWRRYNVPCALLLVDIDFMKQINDKHGHDVGDIVICHVASALIKLSRDNDTPARLGGEEFALLLAGADGAQALAAAERLRRAVSEYGIEGTGAVTVSLGVAACPVHAETERALYTASDAALYRAKQEGRNRVAVAAEKSVGASASKISAIG